MFKQLGSSRHRTRTMSVTGGLNGLTERYVKFRFAYDILWSRERMPE